MISTSAFAKPLTGLLGVLLAVGLVAGGAAGTAAADEQPTTQPSATPAAELPSADQPGADQPAADPTASPTSDPTAADPAPDPSYSLDDSLVAVANAAPVTTSFRADDIISDKNMYTGSAMSAGAVQSFLQAQVPTCRSGYTCLKDYKTATPTMAGDSRCKAYAGSASESAASIVAKVGQACGVSQKALLVLVQKESQLVADDYPIDKQYQQATGFDCSDSAPCNPAYAGFFKQVYWAAWTLKDYKVDPESTQYQVGVPVVVKYSDAPGCDGAELTIRTQATASLYNYTPYQPDADALAGDDKGPCASFGNLNFWIIYTDWFGYPHIDVDRIQAPDRYSESVAIAEEAYPDGAETVYLATGTGYADALSAGPAAVEDRAPLLLTPQDSLTPGVSQEITDLGAQHVVIVGGPNSVSETIETGLEARGLDVARLGGADRFEVSRNVAVHAFGSSHADGAYVATGLNFPDALSASGAGGHNGRPVILVNGGAPSVDQATKELLGLLKVKNVTIAGGPNSVSAGVQSSIAALPGVAVQRVAGADRFAASLAINQDAYGTSDRVFLATGLNFPDALAGSALAGAKGSPLIVVPGNCVPQTVKLSFADFDNTRVTLLGGPNSLDAGVMSLASC